MENYKPNRKGKHFVKYTLQEGEYKGAFTYVVEGDCKGGELLNSTIFHWLEQNEINTYVIDNDCDLTYDIIEDSFYGILKSPDGIVSHGFAINASEMEKMIVSIEIIKYEE